MLGGYVTALLMDRAGVPFLVTLPVAFVIPAMVGVALERTALPPALWCEPARSGAVHDRPRSHGDADRQLSARRPAAADPSARLAVRAASSSTASAIGVYRLFLIVVCGAIAAGLQIFLVGTRFGARLRAAVDDARVASGLGIDVDLLFAITFAVGSGLAGLGGALAADVVGGIDPTFPLKFMVTFLIVVTIGGTNGILGALVGALLLGVLDVAGKYYVPSIGAFIIYFVMVLTLILRPQGLFAERDDGMKREIAPGSASAASTSAGAGRRSRSGSRSSSPIFAVPSRAGLINEILISGLFALSLDLILGLTGIVSLGHAAFFGLGAYCGGDPGEQGLRRSDAGPSRRRTRRRRRSASRPRRCCCAAPI